MAEVSRQPEEAERLLKRPVPAQRGPRRIIGAGVEIDSEANRCRARMVRVFIFAFFT